MAKRKSSVKKTKENDTSKSGDAVVDDVEYEVEKIISHRKFNNGVVEYLIRWKGFEQEDDTWEKESNLTSSAVLIAEYKESNKVSSDEEDDQTNGNDDDNEENGKSDNENGVEDNDDEEEEPATKKKKAVGRPKGKAKTTKKETKSKKTDKKKVVGRRKKKVEEEEDDDDEEEDNVEYEVEKIIDVHTKKNGDKEYLVRWKGFNKKDDTWEPEANLTCPELLKTFNSKLDKIKGASEKSLRAAPKKTDRLSVKVTTPTGRHSKRNAGKRMSYAEAE